MCACEQTLALNDMTVLRWHRSCPGVQFCVPGDVDGEENSDHSRV